MTGTIVESQEGLECVPPSAHHSHCGGPVGGQRRKPAAAAAHSRFAHVHVVSAGNASYSKFM